MPRPASRIPRPVFLALAMGATAAPAQSVPPPVRPLGRVVATSTFRLPSITTFIALGNGRVLASSELAHTVVMLDSTLAVPRIVLDTTPGLPTTFRSFGFLMPYRADSTLFYDGGPAGAFVLIGPEGTLGRTMAVPRPATGDLLRSEAIRYGRVSWSPIFGFVYRPPRPVPARPPAPGQAPVVQRFDDTSWVVRINETTRVADTIAMLSTGWHTVRPTNNLPGRPVPPAPLPFYDEVVITSDGSIALFHAREYRIERIGPDGTRSAGERTPFPWRKVTDDDRRRLVDSLNDDRARYYDSLLTARAADSARTGSPPMSTASAVSATGERTTRQVPLTAPRPPTPIVPEQVADFFPPTNAKAVIADRSNNVWIRELPERPDPAGSVWYVIDPAGRLIDRVRVPPGRTVAGFGVGGDVYLTFRDAGGLGIERARLR